MGNTLAKIRINPAKWGSPPRIWGILHLTAVDHASSGITPTYMGNTRKAPVPGPKDWDHPHVYGEYTTISPLRLCWIGSPPRIWGIQVVSFGNGLVGGITPTYMGNTRTRIKLFLAYEDHPHVYGEYTKRLPANQAFAPSIPQFLFSLLI